jgi:ADP-ribose pyrophosphatase
VIRTLEERVVYRNQYVTVFDDQVAFDDGSTGTYFRTRWTAPFGVAIVPVIGESVLLIRLYRYAERCWSVEIPQGFGTIDGDPAADAERELREETGLEAATLEPLLNFGSDFVTHGFLARFDEGAVAHSRGKERTESVDSFSLMPVAQINAANIAAAGICDANTVGLLFAARDRLLARLTTG